MKAVRNNHEYYISLAPGWQKKYPRYVYPFEWNNYRFFISRQFFHGEYTKVFEATCWLTGMGLGVVGSSPKMVLENAIEKLNTKGLDGLRDSLAQGIEFIAKLVRYDEHDKMLNKELVK